jgi:RNA polymerase sigma-70 factor (ECF subfamily)
VNENSVRRSLPHPSKITQDAQPLVVFRVFHDSYRGPYMRWAELYLGSRANAEDAVHDALLELMKKWPMVLAQAEPGAYAWWLVKNCVKDAARSRTRRQKITDAIFATQALYETTDPIGELETSMALWEAVDALPERQHDGFLLRFNLGYSNRDTAHVLGITEATVRSTIRAIRRRLAEALGIDFKPEEGTRR